MHKKRVQNRVIKELLLVPVTRVFIYLCIYLFVCLLIYLFIYLFIYSFIYSMHKKVYKIELSRNYFWSL